MIDVYAEALLLNTAAGIKVGDICFYKTMDLWKLWTFYPVLRLSAQENIILWF